MTVNQNAKIPRVSPGERVKPTFRASTFNAWTDAANWFNQQKNRGEQGLRQTQSFEPPSIVDIRSKKGSISKNHPVGLDNVGLNNPTVGFNALLQVPFNGVSPSTTHIGKFAMMREGLAQDDVLGDAAVAGAVYCRLFVETNGAWIDRAEVDPSDPTRLITHPGGSAQILWKESSSPNVEMDAFVRLEAPQNVQVPGKAVGTITAGGTGTVDLADGTPLVTTGYTVTARLDWMDGGQDISDGKELMVMWFPDQGVWRVTHAECESADSAFGQLSDDDAYLQTVVSGVADPIDSFDAALELSSPNTTVNSAAGTITLPDIPAGGKFIQVQYNGVMLAPSNNTTVSFTFTIDGIEVPPPIWNLSVQNATNSQTLGISFFTLLSQVTAPEIGLNLESDKSGTITWANRNFSILEVR